MRTCVGFLFFRRTSVNRRWHRHEHSYDVVSRLSQLVQDPAGKTHDLTLGFSYNPASQITQSTRSNDLYAWTGHGSGTTSSSANGLNQIASHGGANTTHDARGNMTGVGGATYFYNSLNQLGSAGGSNWFYHEPLGRLVYINQSATTLDYDGSELITENSQNGFAVLRSSVHVLQPHPQIIPPRHKRQSCRRP